MHSTITEKEKKDDLVVNILSREKEIYHYQVNIDNYRAILRLLPEAWPEHLLKYKGWSPADIASQVPDEHLQQVSDLSFRDKVSKSIRSEIIEQGKARHIYNAMISHFEPAELDTLLAEAINKQKGA